MQEHQLDQQAEHADPTADAATAGAEGIAPEDADIAAAVDEQAATSSGGAAAAAPEVPDDASDAIARAQEHIENLDMDEERAAAKRAM